MTSEASWTLPNTTINYSCPAVRTGMAHKALLEPSGASMTLCKCYHAGRALRHAPIHIFERWRKSFHGFVTVCGWCSLHSYTLYVWLYLHAGEHTLRHVTILHPNHPSLTGGDPEERDCRTSCAPITRHKARSGTHRLV